MSKNSYMEKIGKKAKLASLNLSNLTINKKNSVLKQFNQYLKVNKRSILNENKIYCTTFVINEKIDSGKILLTKRYKIPKKIYSIDSDYDNEIRSINICNVIKKINLIKKKSQRSTTSLPYYIIHPVLRSIVFNKTK